MSLNEVLVILESSTEAQLGAELSTRLKVTQRLPPRMFVATGAADEVADIAGLPGVSAVLSPGQSPPRSLVLSQAERLFVDAWRLRDAPKERLGDGQNWDAPGFTAPG